VVNGPSSRRVWWRRQDDGSAVAGFALVTLAVLPLVMAVLQLAIVWHIENTVTDAASEGARYAAAYQRSPGDGAVRTREAIDASLDDDIVSAISARDTTLDGLRHVEVEVTARIPTLGLWGPSITVHVTGHAVIETLP
jgi:Flp pilus assembly protein TadG